VAHLVDEREGKLARLAAALPGVTLALCRCCTRIIWS
jgi:hypothetical protein